MINTPSLQVFITWSSLHQWIITSSSLYAISSLNLNASKSIVLTYLASAHHFTPWSSPSLAHVLQVWRCNMNPFLVFTLLENFPSFWSKFHLQTKDSCKLIVEWMKYYWFVTFLGSSKTETLFLILILEIFKWQIHITLIFCKSIQKLSVLNLSQS